MSTNEIKQRLITLAKDGQITCAQAMKLANDANVPPMDVGKACDEAKIKITNCQLGCFNGKEKKKR